MKFWTKRTFLSNFIIIFICVFIPCMFFCVLISNLWTEHIKEDTYANDQTMLSLTSHTFDIILHDITKHIDLIEADENLAAALPPEHTNLWELSAAEFLNLDAAWQDSIRTIMAKPYVNKVYMYLERYPNFVFTEDLIIELGNVEDPSWLNEYRQQDANVKLWATPLSAKSAYTDHVEQSICIFRRLPYLYFGEEMEGVLAVSLDKSYFDSLFSNLPQPSQRDIFILDSNGTQIYALQDGIFTQYLQADDIQEGKNIHFSRSTEEGSVLISIVSSSPYDWSYISVIPQDTLLDSYEMLSHTVHTYVLWAFLISVCLAILVTRRNYRPVRVMLQLIGSYNKTGVIENVQKYSSDEYGYIVYNLVQTLISKQEADHKLAEEELLRKEASLLALQSQINPHFLYNTLDAINWESIEQLGLNNSISKMLLCLCSNLRYITKKTDQFVTLREELDNLQQYITLHQLSSNNKTLFEIHAPNHLLEYRLPTLLLQPLVENAVVHGISKMENGTIRVIVTEVSDGLHIEIQDNGCGFPPEKLQAIRNTLASETLTGDESLGLKNVDSRLKLLYGHSHGLQIHSSQGNGCCITIALPSA